MAFCDSMPLQTIEATRILHDVNFVRSLLYTRFEMEEYETSQIRDH